MARDEQDVTEAQLLLMEYQQLKAEQQARIGFRDNLLYAMLASVAAVAAGALQAGVPAALLVLPPVCLLLGWTYLVNDEKISSIGRYVRSGLAPRLATLSAARDQVFGWESAHRDDPRRTTRKYLQLAVDLLAFCVTAAAGLVVYWSADTDHPVALLVVSVLELCGVGVLAWQIWLYADV
ncbi:hypothetical protein SAMN05216223_102387 [Actinacidiphila yanglinensis]|uniref:Integral membrane protein n=1 Tax=Actinacidiphila yanglinensis TaxID=310779 RepID=A0A1H5VPQ4_9ACTN|nr:hypothetical protein [Actinacidiphila yanglinensis]SEF89269.1 hypothetical protein SAMN05216223_102387 [Actinacidiphila yanglinensis]